MFVWPCFSRLLILFLLVAGLGLGHTVHAQSEEISRHSLPDVYRQARYQLQLDRILAEHGLRASPMLPIPEPSMEDTVRAWLAGFNPSLLPPPPEGFVLESWTHILREDRNRWTKFFSETKWAYLGSNFFTPLDTLYTRVLRGRLEREFGPPTRTLGELNYVRDLNLEEYIQFEYWFVLNDSIPVRVMDSNGPFDRGLVVATDHKYREILIEMRNTLLRPVATSPQVRPYVDYYYSEGRRLWYRTGFDGRSFFNEPIAAPNLARGRPRLAPPGG